MLGKDVLARLAQDVVLRASAATGGWPVIRCCCDPASVKQGVDLLSCGLVSDAQALRQLSNRRGSFAFEGFEERSCGGRWSGFVSHLSLLLASGALNAVPTPNR